MIQNRKKGKVLLGMSGGVDSSVAAVLLKEKGFEVIGTTMQLWENVQGTVEDAKKVCEKLEIPHHVIDCTKEFRTHVVENFIECYTCAKTPNPCVECNQYLKFGAFYEEAKKLGCEYIATGHYAKIEYEETYGTYVMKKSQAKEKDQTYFLYGINKEILPKIIFPLADFKNKEEIRKIASDNGLKVAEKKDSQEICFISDNDYVSFLRQQVCGENEEHTIKEKVSTSLNNDNLEENNLFKQGNIILEDGTILGKHSGLINYTIGQRKGLGIAYKEPLYVIKLDTIKNEVVVGTEKELYSNELTANELNFLLDIDLSKAIDIKAKVRYRAKEAEAKLELRYVESEDNQKAEDDINVIKSKVKRNTENSSIKNAIAKVTFAEPQRAITPGQSVVFYLGDTVLGGGKILN